jgi:two-component system LytT family sensor kinase
MNPYDADMQMPTGTGFGLNSVKRRLYLLFARNDLVEINKEKNAFVVVIRIPILEEAPDTSKTADNLKIN